MNLWRPFVQRFLDELLRWEGLGDMGHECAPCKTKFQGKPARRFRCQDCGEFSQCRDCVLSGHSLTPLHRVQVRIRLSLRNKIFTFVRNGMETSGCPSRLRAWAWCINWGMAATRAHIQHQHRVQWS
jgi:hypothetical protein